MKKLFTSTSIVGVSTLVSLIVGVARSKIMAIFLAPAGVGVISQAFSFFTAVATATSLGLGAGIIKYVSRYHKEGKDLMVRQVVVISFILQMALSVLCVALTLLFADRISQMIFSTPSYGRYLVFVALAVPLTTLVYLTTSIFLALGRVKVFTVSRVWGYLGGLIPMFLLIYFWGIRGGFIQILVVSLIGSFFCIYYFIRVVPGKFYLLRDRDEFMGMRVIGKDIVKYGLAMLTSTVAATFSVLIARSLIIHRLGTVANGYYQVLIAFSACYLPFLTNALWSHFYPHASSAGSPEKFSEELNNTLRFITIGATCVIVFLLIGKRYLVPLLFSHKFMDAVPLMQSQLMGDFFFLISTILACSILASGRVKIFFLNAVLTSSVFLLLSLFMFGYFGVFAITFSYVIAQLISTLFIYIYHKRCLNLEIYGNTTKGIVMSLVLFMFIIVLPDNINFIFLKALMVSLWLYMAVKRSEWGQLRRFAGDRWNRFAFKVTQ